MYSKKPFFPESIIEFDKSVMFVGNRIKVTTEGNQSSTVNRSKNNEPLPIINASIIIDNANIWFCSPSTQSRHSTSHVNGREQFVIGYLINVICFVCFNIPINCYVGMS